MSIKEKLAQVVEELPETRAAELLDFAEFLLQRQELKEWDAFGQQEFAKAYGDDEPEYTEADIRRRE